MNPRLRAILIGVVTLVWGANFTAPIFIRDYKPPAETHIVMMAILTALGAVPSKKPPEDDET